MAFCLSHRKPQNQDPLCYLAWCSDGRLQFWSSVFGSTELLGILFLPLFRLLSSTCSPHIAVSAEKSQKGTERNISVCSYERTLLHMLSLGYKSLQSSAAGDPIVHLLRQISTWERNLVFCTEERQCQKQAISKDKTKIYCLYRERMLYSPNPLLKVPIHPWQ